MEAAAAEEEVVEGVQGQEVVVEEEEEEEEGEVEEKAMIPQNKRSGGLSLPSLHPPSPSNNTDTPSNSSYIAIPKIFLFVR